MPPADQEERLAQARARQHAAGVETLRGHLARDEELAEGEGPEELLELLTGLALYGDEFPQATAAGELLHALGLLPSREPQYDAFELLVRLGRLDHDENLARLRARLPGPFSPELLDEAHRLAPLRPWEDPRRVDLTGLLTVTIDDPETNEVDDALSVRRGPGDGWTFWVHIADPGAFLPPGSALWPEAARRAATLYLPEGRTTMLPAELAEGPCSLTAGFDRAALTLQAEVTVDGELRRSRLLVSRVRVDHRLSYEEADLRMHERGELGDLLHHLQEGGFALEAMRRAAGAFVLNGPEVKVRRHPGGRVTVTPVDRYSPSRSLVAEMMILMGACAARLFLRHGIPAIYRVQDPPDSASAPPDGPQDAASFYVALRRMRRAELSRIPGRHAGLGVEPYVQITSPIRRYGDLLQQEQLRAFLLTGVPRYTEEELLDRLGNAEATSAQLTAVERESKRFWTLRYLEQHGGETLAASVLEERNPGHYLVDLSATCLRAPLDAPPGLPVGTRLTLALGPVDARRDRISLRYLGRSTS